MTGTQGSPETHQEVAAAHETCWLCDGRIKGDEGVTVPSLAGVAVHKRCLPDLAFGDLPLA